MPLALSLIPFDLLQVQRTARDCQSPSVKGKEHRVCFCSEDGLEMSRIMGADASPELDWESCVMLSTAHFINYLLSASMHAIPKVSDID
ncbi:Uncharacterized protein DAT39_005017 [Clarias magur]|uniref:Uncharacterized protein n=1 Tax=Clarias magur TaxID=1594786 RepID=A0A8J4U3Q0_CLAMG|nr:Uncharacterized protein DAT39_005017 [Clarias magur]